MERLEPEQLNPILDPGSPSSFAGFETAKVMLWLQGLNFTLSQLSLLVITLLCPKEAVEADFRMFGCVLWKIFLGRLQCLRWICCQVQTRFFLGWTKTEMMTQSARKHQHFGCLTLRQVSCLSHLPCQDTGGGLHRLWNFGSGPFAFTP
jgi:hypothetical protein